MTKIRQRGSQVRGEVKRQVRPLTVSHYHFEASNVPAEIAHTKEMVALLKDKNTLVYKVCASMHLSLYVLKIPQDHDTRKGLFENPVLQRTINNQWFGDAHAEGVVFHLYYNPMPLPTMALVFTCLHGSESRRPMNIPAQLELVLGTNRLRTVLMNGHLANSTRQTSARSVTATSMKNTSGAWKSGKSTLLEARSWPGFNSAFMTKLGETYYCFLFGLLILDISIHSKAGGLEPAAHSRITDDDFEAAVREAAMEDM